MVKLNKKNVKLNLLKGFACIGVVFIHITFPGVFGQIVKYASSYAVPVFFMIAGYYAFGKDAAVIRRRTLKIGRIFVVAYALFFIVVIAPALVHHEAYAWLGQHFSWKTPILYIVFCTVDFAIPLWYLIAMLEIYVFWICVIRKGKERPVVRWIPVFFLLRAILIIFCGVRKLDWFWHVNFMTQGMPWFLLGYYLHTDHAERIRNSSPQKLVLIAAAGLLVSVMPAVLPSQIRVDALGDIPLALGLFTLTLKAPGESSSKPIEYIGEHLSLPIYILHVPVSVAVQFFFGSIIRIDTNKPVFAWCRPIIVLAGTVFLSWMVTIGIKAIQKRMIRNDSV